MSDYDFTTLSPIDFEQIVRDLLQAHWKTYLESFKLGRDGGIDFRYSEDKNGDLIVQVKHYVRTGFDGLLAHLKNEEKSKIKKLNPGRYVLVTSVPLSPGNKKTIKDVLSPYIKRISDVYGKDDINNLLGLYPRIEKQHFKLWLSSTSVLEEILHSQLMNQTKMALTGIEKKALIYVMNESFKVARDILKKYNYVIIAGVPGIGKSTLAEMLVWQYIRDGYEFIDVSNDINEAYSIQDHKHPRIVLYDDFLGRTSLQEKLNKNEDNRLYSYISTVRSSKHTKLILTTRQYILNQARQTYEVLNSPLFEMPQCVINLSVYTRKIRAEILYNHFYHSRLQKEYISEVVQQVAFIKIIDHPNYSPRIMEYMTDPAWVERHTPEEYPSVFLNNLQHPFLIWEQAYQNQISALSQDLLLVLATLPREVFLDDLRSALTEFYSLRGYSLSEREFNDAVREIEDNFILVKKSRENLTVEFHNPSIQDYIEKYLEAHPEYYLNLARSAIFFEQAVLVIRKMFSVKNINHQEETNGILANALEKTLHSKSCTLINYYFSENNRYKGRGSVNLGERLRIIAAFVTMGRSNLFDKVLLNELSSVLEQIRLHKIENGLLLKLIQDFAKLEIIKTEFMDSLLKTARTSFLENNHWISDISSALEFIKMYPNVVEPEDDKKIILDTLNNLAKSVLYLDDVQVVSDELNDLRRIEDEHGFGLEKIIDKIDALLSELESNAPYIDEEDYRDDFLESDKDLTDEDLIGMFSTLS